MPRVEVQPLAPYDQSPLWQIQDAYFAGRGLAAWTESDIPWQATSNVAISRQHAKFLTGLFAGGSGPIDVLEIGAGLGVAGANLLRTLDRGRRDEREVGRRIRYVMSDTNAENMRAAAEMTHLKDLVEAGRVVMAVYDVRTPDTLHDLQGRPIAVDPKLVVAHYVACCTPPKVLAKTMIGWLERYVRLTVESDLPPAEAWQECLRKAVNPEPVCDFELSWRPVDLDAALGPTYANAVRRTLDPVREATVCVPYKFWDVIRRYGPSAVVLVCDFGEVRLVDLVGERACKPVMYGHATSHPVDFPLLDGLTDELGLDLARTADPTRAINIAAVAPHGHPTLGPAFARAYAEARNEEFLDQAIAARKLFDDGDAIRAARIYKRLVRWDPDNADLQYRYGLALLEATIYDLALPPLRKARRLDPGLYDYAFPIGRACARVGYLDTAKKELKASIAQRPSPWAWTELGLVYETDRQWKRAEAALREALALHPEFAPATAALQRIGAKGPRGVTT